MNNTVGAVAAACALLTSMLFSGCRPALPPPPPPGAGSFVAPDPGRQPSATPDAGSADASKPDPEGDAGAPETAPPVDMMAATAPGCGTGRPDVSRLMNVDGLAIGNDGTLYFTQGGIPDGWVGRLLPGAAEPERQWVRVPQGDRLWGLALDNKLNRLYIVSTGAKAIHWVDTTAAVPPLVTLALGLMDPNDIAIGPDGHVYYSDATDRHVHRVGTDGIITTVTTTPIGNSFHPAGLAFGPDGALYVGTSAGNGPIFRLELQDGAEVSRRSYGHYIGWGNGLTFDMRGRLYLATYAPAGVEARVVRIASDESGAIEITAGIRFSSMAFGRGALGCKDLYIASPAGSMIRFESDAPGLPLP